MVSPQLLSTSNFNKPLVLAGISKHKCLKMPAHARV
jgi:hypothetical protein